ncbi:hypothetical protein [Halosimplex pelagicum]|uniref:Uncharacterized protein n=1 Tax=Halosimplex pelagicum TaxID=869886 RepID=A0A7D5PDS8_9EURY|nr:hypothetical protein [Halosimplex pelagicum]QLH81360.1 hypothetical protein HZS54_06855 [Halosimplex pelagicum]
MRSSKPSRIVLLSAFVALGVSIAVFLSVTGVTSALTADPTHEIELRDSALILDDGTNSKPVLEDVSRMERIEITTVDGQVFVSAKPRDLPTLDTSQRELAKQIVASDGSIVDREGSATSALYTIYPVFETMSNRQAAVIGADTRTRHEYLTIATNADFSVQENATENSVVFKRADRPVSEDRVVVVIDQTESDTRYSVVVNLDRETVETVVQFDPTGR